MPVGSHYALEKRTPLTYNELVRIVKGFAGWGDDEVRPRLALPPTQTRSLLQPLSPEAR